MPMSYWITRFDYDERPSKNVISVSFENSILEPENAEGKKAFVFDKISKSHKTVKLAKICFMA